MTPNSASASSCARRRIDRFHVITGGPGSGKTSLIEALAAAGFVTRPEAGRAVIRREMANGGTALPWADAESFAQAMLLADVAAYAEAEAFAGPLFFDRGVPDLVGYRRLAGLPCHAATEAAARDCRYAMRVFIAPPWPEIYTGDAERRQTLAEAEATYAVMAEVYPALGYELIELPRAPIAERVAFVRGVIGA